MKRIILISGIPGSGKSSVALRLTEHFDRCDLIEGDVIQHVLTFRGCVGPGEEPQAESERQYRLRWKNCVDLANNFYDEDFTVILEHVATPQWIEHFIKETAPRALSVITLVPTVETTLKRDLDRTGKHVAQKYAWLDGVLRDRQIGYWLDSTELSLDQTVEKILTEGLEKGHIQRP